MEEEQSSRINIHSVLRIDFWPPQQVSGNLNNPHEENHIKGGTTRRQALKILSKSSIII